MNNIKELQELQNQAKITARVSGHYEVFIKRQSGEVTKVTETDNLITDSGLASILADYNIDDIFGSCMVGTGTTNPTFADSDPALVINPIYHNLVEKTRVVSEVAPYSLGFKRTYLFPVELTFKSYTQVACVKTLDSNTISSHAHFPAPVIVQVGEQIIIAFTATFTLADNIQGTISGYPYYIRAAWINGWDYANLHRHSVRLAPVSFFCTSAVFVNRRNTIETRSGTGLLGTTTTTSNALIFSVNFLPASYGLDVNTIWLEFGYGFWYQINFTLPIHKTFTKSLALILSLTISR